MGDRKPAEDGCNTCRCEEGGTWVCTETDCAPVGECDPGDTRPAEDGCNTCRCQEDGDWVCTDVDCETPAECEPGETKPSPDGCGGCTCGEDGTWGCIDIGCETPTECEPGDLMLADNGCSTCRCQEDGTWSCTEPECGVPGECEPGDTLPTDNVCTTCVCSAEGTWSCTDDGCAECTPGETRTEPETCTTCTCDDAGAWICKPDEVCPILNCPEPRDIPDGLDCVAAEAIAKNPETGQCCTYGTPCAVPDGWDYYDTEAECAAASPLACPEPIAYEGLCDEVLVWAADPATGVCCQYGTPCNAPSGWHTYYTESVCLAAQQSGKCESGNPDFAILGAHNSFGECSGACRHDLQITLAEAACGSVVLTMSGWVETDPTWSNTGILTPAGNLLAYSLGYDLRDVSLDDVYGCPDCADGGASTITLRRDGLNTSHAYDWRDPPDVLADADAFVQSVMNALRSCESNGLVDVDLEDCLTSSRS